MTTKGILVAAVVCFGGAVYGLHTEKMRVVTVCHDSRLFMDGGIDANIEGGGINYHHEVFIYRHHHKKDEFLQSTSVDHESAIGEPETVYSGPNLKLTIYKDRPATKYGVPAQLESVSGNDKISVALLCAKK